MKIFYSKNNKGFTLVETLVALSIFSVSLVGLISVLGRGISNTGYVKDKDTAAYLAQEGIEYMRNMRDTYVLYTSPASAGWTSFNNKLSGGSCATVNGCYFNADSVATTTSIAFSSCSSINCTNAPMLYNSANGRYGYTTGTTTPFIRKIRMEVVDGNETKIISTVFWTKGSGTYNITLSESLFNWVE
jgi:type II secretion system protein I